MFSMVSTISLAPSIMQSTDPGTAGLQSGVATNDPRLLPSEPTLLPNEPQLLPTMSHHYSQNEPPLLLNEPPILHQRATTTPITNEPPLIPESMSHFLIVLELC
jgi:hypothetical protein